MIQTWWLSYVDPSRPTGSQFLGALVIDVDEADCVTAAVVATAIRRRHGLPAVTDPSDAGFAAAGMKAQELGVNPGGEVRGMRLDDAPHWPTIGPCYPRGRLLSRADIDTIDDAIALRMQAADQ